MTSLPQLDKYWTSCLKINKRREPRASTAGQSLTNHLRVAHKKREMNRKIMNEFPQFGNGAHGIIQEILGGIISQPIGWVIYLNISSGAILCGIKYFTCGWHWLCCLHLHIHWKCIRRKRGTTPSPFSPAERHIRSRWFWARIFTWWFLLCAPSHPPLVRLHKFTPGFPLF